MVRPLTFRLRALSKGSKPPLVFEVIYEHTYGLVRRALRRFGVEDTAMDDAVQDVYLVIHRQIDSFEGRSTVSTWVYGIARRVAADQRRRSRRHAELSHADATAATPTQLRSSDNPYEDVARRQASALLETLIAEIPFARREVFILSEFEAMTGPEIADALELELDTVYWRLRTARKEFDEALDRHQARERWREQRPRLLAEDDADKRRSKKGVLALIVGLNTPSTGSNGGTVTAGATWGATVKLAAVTVAVLGIAAAIRFAPEQQRSTNRVNTIADSQLVADVEIAAVTDPRTLGVSLATELGDNEPPVVGRASRGDQPKRRHTSPDKDEARDRQSNPTKRVVAERANRRAPPRPARAKAEIDDREPKRSGASPASRGNGFARTVDAPGRDVPAVARRPRSSQKRAGARRRSAPRPPPQIPEGPAAAWSVT